MSYDNHIKICFDGQYNETLGSFKNSLGGSLTNTGPQYLRSMPVVSGNSVLNFNVP